MKVLVAIPHYYRPTAVAPDGRPHGSVNRNPAPRVAALAAALRGLARVAAPRACALDHTARLARRIDPAEGVQIDTVVCTTGGDHLLGRLPAASGRWERHATRADPPLLGYECHAVLRDRLGRYDWYGYLEDDIILTDPAFFRKLAWFNRLFGDGRVLQPNRFETGDHPDVDKMYVDGPLPPHCLNQPPAVPELTAEAFGQPVVFRTSTNPHAGCFFLTAAQMEHWSRQPTFLDRSSAFIGSLESAATLGVATTFQVYKPGWENADFLDIRHDGTGYFSLLSRQV